MKFDVIVVGAGTAGCMAAYSAAKEGISKIILIDKKSKNQIGNKICGDGIGINHLTFLEDNGFPIKESNIILNKIKTAYLVSPNSTIEDKINIEGHLAIIDRYNFGQTLLKGVLEQRVKLLDKSTIKTIKRKTNEIELNVERKDGESLTIRAPLVIDCSGFHSKIREKSNFFDENYTIKDDEQYYCYREISEIENAPDMYIDSAIFEFSYEKTKG